MADDPTKTSPLPQGGDPIPDALKAMGVPDGDVVEARVLLAYGDQAPNDVVSGPRADIVALMVSGHVDPHPDAVAHAKSLA